MNQGGPSSGHNGGVVTAAVAAAADVGFEMLAAGGNAFDAAVSAALAETVWLPMKCGLGGDVIALFQRAGGLPRSLLSVGRGPLALADGAILEGTGALSVGAFGAPEGYARLAQFGRLPLSDLVAPAAEMARTGVHWLPQAVRLTEESQALIERYNPTTPFLPDGRLPQVGATLKLPNLGRLLEIFGAEGGALFHGDAGAIVLDHLASQGGVLRRDDLIRAVATEMPCTRVPLPGGGALDVTPLPTHGPVHADALLRILDGMGEVDAVRTARKVVDFRAGGGTSVVTAADGKGNRVVLVHSNSFPRYGSGVIVPEFDLILNNRPGRGFAIHAPQGHWNAPDPLSVPATTLNAWRLSLGDVEFWGGTPGGENQAVWNSQVTHRLLRGLGPQQAIDAPKWALAPDGAIVWEEDHPDRDPADRSIAAHSHRSALQIIAIDGRTQALTAGVDPRTEPVARYTGSE